MPCILEANESSKGYQKNWARLIQKIYEVDPLTCLKCQWKNSPVFMSEFPYLVVPLVLQRIQYYAMNGKPPTSLLAYHYYTEHCRLDA